MEMFMETYMDVMVWDLQTGFLEKSQYCGTILDYGYSVWELGRDVSGTVNKWGVIRGSCGRENVLIMEDVLGSKESMKVRNEVLWQSKVWYPFLFSRFLDIGL